MSSIKKTYPVAIDHLSQCISKQPRISKGFPFQRNLIPVLIESPKFEFGNENRSSQIKTLDTVTGKRSLIDRNILTVKRNLVYRV